MNKTKPSYDDFLNFLKAQCLEINDPRQDENLNSFLKQCYKITKHAVALKQLINIDPYIYKSVLYNYTIHLFIISCVDNYLSFIPENILQKMNIDRQSVNGIVQNASDNTTAASILVPDSYKNLSSGDVNSLRTPYGRICFMITQQFGELWGLN